MSQNQSVELVEGPSVSQWTREAAEKGLQEHPEIAKGAPYTLHEFKGQWIAAIVHEADSPFGGPNDETEEAPGPKSEGPDDSAPSSDGGPDDDLKLDEPVDGPSDNPDGPPSDEGDKPKSDKGGEKHEIVQILEAIKQIGEALGIPIGGGLGNPADPDDPTPETGGVPVGPGGPPVPPPPPGPPGFGGPHGDPKDNTQHIIHEKALKPGEVPPGGTPVGAPAFSHVREDHPWKRTAGTVASFVVFTSLKSFDPADQNEAYNTLKQLTSEIGGGYKVKNFSPYTDENGQPAAEAVITLH